MILVRNSFVAKPGQASKLAKMFKELAVAASIPNHRVMTDLTGEFNRVVFEFEAQNLSEVESRLQEYATRPVFREKLAGYTDLYDTGKREIFQIVS